MVHWLENFQLAKADIFLGFCKNIKEAKSDLHQKEWKIFFFGCILTYFLVVASDKSSLGLYDSLAISGIIYGFVYQLNSSFCHDMMPLKRMTTFPSATLLLPLAAKALKCCPCSFISILSWFYTNFIQIKSG